MLSIPSSLVYDGGTLEEPSVHICRSSDSTVDPEYSLNVLAISLFLKIISPFSFNIMSVSALLCLFEKKGLHFTQKHGPRRRGGGGGGGGACLPPPFFC